MENKKEIAQQEEHFAEDCKLINLRYEYRNYTGSETWAIVTELSEAELQDKYHDILDHYIPFILLTKEQAKVMKDFHNNESKHQMRTLRSGVWIVEDDNAFEGRNRGVAVLDRGFERIEEREAAAELNKQIESLDDIQRSRIRRFYFEGKSFSAIAREDKVSRQAVAYSIRGGIEKLKKFYF